MNSDANIAANISGQQHLTSFLSFFLPVFGGSRMTC